MEAGVCEITDGKQLTRETIWKSVVKLGLYFRILITNLLVTVEDDVAFGLENQGIPREEMLQRVRASWYVGASKDREPSRFVRWSKSNGWP